VAVPGKESLEMQKIHEARKAIGAALDALVRMNSKANPEVRVAALEALSETAVDIETHVRNAMQDRDELVRTTAVELAGEQRLVNLKQEIVRRFRSDRSWLVRSAAAVALGDLGLPDARTPLLERIERSCEEERVRIYYALVRLGGRKFLKPFLEGLNDPFYRIRCATANLLPALVVKSDRRRIVKLLTDALHGEQTDAARSSLRNALEQIGDDRGGDNLLASS